MRNAGIDADHQVETLTQSRRLAEVPLQLGEVQYFWMLAQHLAISCTDVRLQIDVLAVRRKSHQQLLERRAAAVVVGKRCTVAPGETHTASRGAIEPRAPA